MKKLLAITVLKAAFIFTVLVGYTFESQVTAPAPTKAKAKYGCNSCEEFDLKCPCGDKCECSKCHCLDKGEK